MPSTFVSFRHDVRCSREASGQFARAAWAKTEAGRAAVDETASLIRFSLLGKTRAAARRLWRQLAAMARDTAVVTTIELDVQAYLQRLGELAFADGLPRGGVELRRLIVVPSVLLNGAAYMSLAKRLGLQPAFASLEGGDALRESFLTTLISEIEAAIASACPSPAAPLINSFEASLPSLSRAERHEMLRRARHAA